MGKKIIFVLFILVLLFVISVPVKADDGEIPQGKYWFFGGQKVVDVTQQKFNGRSVDEIVRRAWLELMGEDLSGPRVVTVSLDEQNYVSLLGILCNPDYVSRESKMFYYPIRPNWPLDSRVSHVRIHYRKNSFEFILAVWGLAHEYAHASKSFSDPIYIARTRVAYERQEDFANFGAMAITRYLEESYGIPRINHPFFYESAGRIGPWHKNQLIWGEVSSSDLAYFFKTGRTK